MVIGPAQPSHWGFIYSSFIKSIREASTHVEGMSGKQIGQLLTNLVRDGWTVSVAELESVIAGWVLYDGAQPQRLGWVLVRDDLGFRSQGLGKLLAERVGINMSLPVISPFVPNRSRDCRLRLKIRHRPFLCIAPPVDVQ
jgi:hypothetical protein